MAQIFNPDGGDGLDEMIAGMIAAYDLAGRRRRCCARRAEAAMSRASTRISIWRGCSRCSKAPEGATEQAALVGSLSSSRRSGLRELGENASSSRFYEHRRLEQVLAGG